jgi:prophage antirepressor-like protein/phage antirepressor YoqD-like protein
LSNIIPFTFPGTGQSLRSVTIGSEPWFHHGDVCKILQHTNPTVAARMLDDDESDMLDLRELSAGQTALNEFRAPATGNAEARFVTEPGLYTLMFNSKAKGAPAFRRWITHEVIPSIRKTGSYGVVPSLPDITSPAGALAMAEQFVVVARQLVAADERIAVLEPKAVIADRFLTAQKGDRLVRQVAKELSWREKDLRRFLLDEHMIFARERACDSGTEYDFYASVAGKFRTVEHTVEHRWGPCNHYTLYVTPSGMELVQRRINRQQAAIRAAIADGAA